MPEHMLPIVHARRHGHLQLGLLLSVLVLTTQLQAQTELAKAKELYAAASFEEALTALDRAPAGDGIEVVEYRILCLLALDRADEAQRAVAGLLQVQPRYQPKPSLMSPQVRARFEDVRARIVKTEYAEAKASFDAKDYRLAHLRFDRMLELASGSPEEQAFHDLQLLATGFRDLARGLSGAPANPIAPTGKGRDDAMPPARETTSAVTVPFQGAVDGIYDPSAGNVVPPIPLKPILPPVRPESITPVPSPGLFEIVIDEKGHVESVVVRRSISEAYDALVLNESRRWRYRPATLNGKAVKFRKLIELYSTSLRAIAQG